MEDLLPLLAAIERSALGEAVRMLPPAYPLLECLHILGIALLVGPALAVDLRLMGLAGRDLPARRVLRGLLPLCHAGFALAALSGALMFAGIARQAGLSAAAPWKLGLIALAGVNIAVFHLGIYRRVADWDRTAPPLAARLAGGISALSWAGALIAGRYLAYL